MSGEEAAFFAQWPELLPVYAALREALLGEFARVEARVQRTQISLREKHVFAVVSLPRTRRRPGQLIVSFGLPCRLDAPRIAQAVEPYPNRWTHHVMVERAEQVDAELLGWLREAYWFSMAK